MNESEIPMSFMVDIKTPNFLRASTVSQEDIKAVVKDKIDPPPAPKNCD